MKLMRVGVDLAKNVIQVHGVDRKEQPVWRRRLSRKKWLKVLLETVEPGCEIGMEASSSAHYWARQLQQGETVLASIRHPARVLAWILVISHRLGYKAQQRLSLRDPVLEPSRDHSASRDCVRGSTLSSASGYPSLSRLVAQDWPYPVVCSHLAGPVAGAVDRWRPGLEVRRP